MRTLRVFVATKYRRHHVPRSGFIIWGTHIVAGLGSPSAVSEASQLSLSNNPWFCCDEVSQRVSAAIPPGIPVLITIHLEHILRPVRIMLKRRQALHQPRTPF